MGVGHDFTIRSVDTDGVLVVTIANLKDIGLGLVGAVVGDTNTIEAVLAKLGTVGAVGVAKLDAHSTTTEEDVPVRDLAEIVSTSGEEVREDQTTDGVTTLRRIVC